MKNRLKNLLLLPLLAVLIALSAAPAAAYDYNPFTDISESAWYYRDVMNAVNAGLVNGKTKTTFCPDDYLTYAEAVKLASCLNQLWWTGEITLSNGSPWYQNYVDYAWTVGIIDDNYNWTGYASRGAFLAIFANAVPTDALGRINSVPDNSIPDVSLWYPNAWAIYALYRAGIVQGSDKAHSCYPDNPIKRSEVAAILTRMTDPSARLYFTMDSPDAASWDYEVYEDYEGYDTAEEEPANPKYWITVDFYDRDDLTVYTEGTTLGLILLENGIELAEGEVPSVDLWDDWLAEDMTVSVDKYAYRSEDVHRIEARTTEEIGIDTIPRGDVNILEEGADGESIMHYTVTYKNGAEIDRTLEWEEVLTAMVPQVYEIGVGGTIVGKDGTTYSYSWKRICSATYYNIYNYTYSGNYVSTQTVATNLNYIPIGTRMYVKNDRYDFGYRVSEDTGSGLAPWQLDIWMPADDPNAPLMSVEGFVKDMEVYFLD